MDWIHVLTIILSFIGINTVFFVYLLTRMDNGFREMQKQIGDLQNQLIEMRLDIRWLKFRLDPHEHHNPTKEEELKEN